MKKLFFITILTSLFSVLAVQAQDFKRFHWGFYAGIQGNEHTTILPHGDQYIASPKAQFIGGAFVEYKFTRTVGLSLDANYSGMNISEAGYPIDLGYVTTPLLVNFHLTNSRLKNVVDAYIGLTPAFSVSSGKSASSFDLMATIGFRFMLYKGLFLDTRANAGMINVFKGNEYKSYNMPVSLAIGWRF